LAKFALFHQPMITFHTSSFLHDKNKIIFLKKRIFSICNKERK